MDLIFFICIFIAAMLYSSVGHGGASGYLALMALFSFQPDLMKVTALTLNLFVAFIAFYSFYSAGHFRFKLLWPFAVTSIPFSFLGGLIEINSHAYKIILGICLLIAIRRMLFKQQPNDTPNKDTNVTFAIIIGIFLGFFSGLIGIGGGIILSPLLLLFKWGNLKEVATVSAAFIFLNSASGLTGHLLKGVSMTPQIVYFVVAGVIGGLIGSRVGSKNFSTIKLTYSLVVVLLIASIKLFLV